MLLSLDNPAVKKKKKNSLYSSYTECTADKWKGSNTFVVNSLKSSKRSSQFSKFSTSQSM